MFGSGQVPAPPPNSGHTDRPLGLDEFRLRWFDQFLKGLDTGILDERPLRLYVTGGGSGRRSLFGHMLHGGYWRDAENWPPDGPESVASAVPPDGALRREPPGSHHEPTPFVFDPADPVPTIGGKMQDPPAGSAKAVVAGGAFDQRGQPNLPVCKDLL